MVLKCKCDVLKVVYIEWGVVGGILGFNGNLFERLLIDSGNDIVLWIVMVYFKYWLFSWVGSCYIFDVIGLVF